ncbi:MAG TPA: flavin reductase family protein, partial [Candidatus Polarisedimenticolaceae bacterium]|nr:flavin reductase family protein [Candidatus Polarisedimenticolaceae bacterium]
MRVPVPLRRAYKLINHGPTTLITSASGERRNVMAAAWVMGLDYEPARLAAVIASGTHTRTLVEETGEFVVNVPTLKMIDTVYAVGKVSGTDEDKFAEHRLATSPASIVAAPLLDGCAAWLECRVIREMAI